MNASPAEEQLSTALESQFIQISSTGFGQTISGQGIEDFLSTLNSGALDADIASSSVIILNLGVNNWNEVNSDGLATVTGWIDSVIAYILSVNPDIGIVWQEPHAVAGLVSNPDIATNTLQIAAYLNGLSNPNLCVPDWSSYADANPSVYTNLTNPSGNPLPADGVHIYGNESQYIDVMMPCILSWTL